jgi:hypothetical protein
LAILIVRDGTIGEGDSDRIAANNRAEQRKQHWDARTMKVAMHCQYPKRSDIMSEITRAYRFGALTGAVVVAAATVVAVVAVALGA